MDELQISGKRFISSRRIAREHGYTSDYIGQLIRGGKIAGQKVGRAWYVEEESFNVYLGAERTAVAITPTSKTIEQVDIPDSISNTVSHTAPLTETQATESFVEKEAEQQNSIELASLPSHIEVAPMVKEAASHVPLRIVKHNVYSEKAKDIGGLRYYTDDLPTLPHVRTSYHDTRAVPTVFQKGTEVKDISNSKHEKFYSPLFVGGLATLGISFFLIVSLVSSTVSLHLSIGKDGVAAASYSINW